MISNIPESTETDLTMAYEAKLLNEWFTEIKQEEDNAIS